MKALVLGIASCLAAILAASSAVAASSPAGQVQSLRVDPAAAAHGAAVTATVEVTNPGDKRSKPMNLLLKLRAPDGQSGLLLTSRQVGKLGPGKSRTVELAAFIPDGAPSGDSTLVACRAKKDTADACGISRQEAALRVLTPANLRISPGAHAFESHPTGTTSPTRTFTITNTGETASGPIATSITGADPNQFTKSADGCDGRALAPGESCEVSAAFSPTATGAKSGGLRAQTADSSATAALTGTGVVPANLAISPSPHGFGTHATGTTSGAQTFTVTNTGAVPSGTIATSLGGADAGQFAKSADACNGQTLGPGASCTMSGAFAPTSTGGKSATLGATAAPGGTASTTLNGTGASPANLTISPTPKAFGTVLVGSSSAVQTFTVTNTGGVPTGTISTQLAGSNANQFTKSNDNCDGQTLAAGVSCTIDGAFTPTASGPKAATLIAGATPGGGANAIIGGTGQTPAHLTLTPATFDFGNVLQGTSSPARTFTITNTGEQSTGNLTVLLFTNLPPLRFGGPNPCGTAPLAGGASCSVQITFAPQAGDTGSFGADLSASASPGGTASSTLSGTAVTTPANLQISITDENAGTPGTYGSSSARNLGTGIQAGDFTRSKVWIKNTGAADATVPASAIPFSTTGGSFQAIAPVSTCNVADEPQIRFTNPVIVGGAECYVVVTGGPNVTNQPFSTSFTITGTPGGSITGTISGN